ncbi:MAG: hypothetical protein L6Q78_11595 [Bacteroidia bacterium]|nr:hypothetical protein [Bacteroidia bacterium]
MIGGELSSCFACTKPIQFRAAETRLLVCHSCGSVNFRKPEWKESNLIHCAAIPPDRSPYALGQYLQKEDKSTWEIIGRIRYQLQEGYWNQWVLCNQTGEVNHLLESAGYMAWCESKALGKHEVLSGLKLYAEINLPGGQKVQVDSLDKNLFIDLEGELDSVHLRSTQFFQANLSNNYGDFAMVFIYSSVNQEMFIGKYGDFNTFKPIAKP